MLSFVFMASEVTSKVSLEVAGRSVGHDFFKKVIPSLHHPQLASKQFTFMQLLLIKVSLN
jgi:hypothetical protein